MYMNKEFNPGDYVAAIDIGTTKIVAIVGQRQANGRVKIVGMSKTASRGVKRGVVLNIEESVNSIQQAIEAVQLKTGMILDDVYVGIAGQHIRSIRNRGSLFLDNHDEIRKEDLDKLLADMYKIPIDVGEEIIHVLPQNFIVDNETGVKNPIGIAGRRLEGNFHIVVGQVSTMKTIEKCVNRCGLRINNLILEPLASAHAVLTDDEMEAGVVLVDIGGGTTDLAVYYDGIIRHTAVIPFGGNVVTDDIKEGCALLHRDAEDLKVKYGSALGDIAPADKVVTLPGINGREAKEISFKSLAYIIQSRMEEIIEIISFELEASGYADKLAAGIVVTGGGSLLRHLPQLMKFKTGLDVKIGYPFESLQAEKEEDINHPMYSTSIGLILKGFEYNDRKGIKVKMVDASIKIEPLLDMPVRKKKKNSGFLDSVKNTISNIFEEDDAKM